MSVYLGDSLLLLRWGFVSKHCLVVGMTVTAPNKPPWGGSRDYPQSNDSLQAARVAVEFACPDISLFPSGPRQIKLFLKEGIPASPFRTDGWPLFDPDNYIPKEQLKPEKPADYNPVPLKRPSMTQ